MVRTILTFLALAAIVVLLRVAAWQLFRLGRPLSSRLRGFLAACLDPKHFSGPPLTLIIVAEACILTLITGLVGELLEAEELVRFDEWINRSLSAFRSDGVLVAFSWLTDIGASASIIAVALVASGLLWAHRRAAMMLPLWVAVIGSQISIYAGKYALLRPRP